MPPAAEDPTSSTRSEMDSSHNIGAGWTSVEDVGTGPRVDGVGTCTSIISTELRVIGVRSPMIGVESRAWEILVYLLLEFSPDFLWKTRTCTIFIRYSRKIIDMTNSLFGPHAQIGKQRRMKGNFRF
jgi:hypothetical protein